MSAIISVPPVEPPTEMLMPIPTPAMRPPMSTDISLPFWRARVFTISAGMSPGRNLSDREARIMAYIVLAPNPIPRIIIANTTRMALRTK